MTDYYTRMQQLLAELEDEAAQAIANLSADIPFEDVDPLPWWV